MGHLLKRLIFAKVGAGLVTSYVAYKKKFQAINAIEQSEFHKTKERLINHPETRRRDGFNKVSYQFKGTYNEKVSIEAIAEKYQPADNISENDSLEISVHSDKETMHIRQVIKAKPFIDSDKLPEFLKKGLFSAFYIKSYGSKPDIKAAFEILESILGRNGEPNFYPEAERI